MSSRAGSIAAGTARASATGATGALRNTLPCPSTAWWRCRKPLDLTRASLLACPAGVALQGLTAVGVSAGETVVVVGAGGGLGVHSVQLSKAMGARTIAVTSTSGKATVLYRHGADEVIESPPAGSGLDFWEVILALTQDEGADVVVDTVGTPTIRSSIRSLGQYGRLVLLGEVGGDGDLRGLIPEIVFRDARLVGSSGVSRHRG